MSVRWTWNSARSRFAAIRIARSAAIIRRSPKPIDYEQFCGVPILDPKIIGRDQAGSGSRERRPEWPGSGACRDFDEKGLPPGYPFKPDWEVTPREVKSMLDQGREVRLYRLPAAQRIQITNIDGAKLIPLAADGRQLRRTEGHTRTRRSSSTARAADGRCSSRRFSASRDSRT